MAEKLGSAVLEIKTDDKGYRQGVNRAEKSARGLEKGLKRTTASADRLGKRLAVLGGRMKRLGRDFRLLRNGAIAGAAALTALFLVAKRAIETADKIGKTAKSIGITAESLQELRFAAGRAGVDIGALDKQMAQFSKRIAELQTRVSSELKTALEAFNPVLLQSLQTTTDTTEALRLVADAVQNAATHTEAMAIATAAFGSRQGPKFIEMLRGGSKGLDDMAAKARSLGIVLSNDIIARSEKAADELGDMTAVLKTAAIALGLEFMPLMRELFAFLTDPAAIKGARELGSALTSMFRFIVDNAKVITIVLSALVGLRLGAVLGKFGAISGGLAGLAAGVALLNEAATDLGRSDPNLDARAVALAKITDELNRMANAAKGAGGQTTPELSELEKKVKDIVAALEFEREQLGHTAEEQELYNNLKAAGVTLASDYGQTIAAATKELLDAEKATAALIEREERLNETQEFFGDISARAFGDLVPQIESGIEALDRLVESLIEAVLQAALLGKGPLGGLFGGGLGSLFGGGNGATGAPMNILPRFAHGGTLGTGKLGIVGEAGPEIIQGPATITPFAGAAPVTVNVINKGEPLAVEGTRQRRGPGGEQVIEVMVKKMVKKIANDGGLDQTFASNFGIRRSVGAPV